MSWKYGYGRVCFPGRQPFIHLNLSVLIRSWYAHSVWCVYQNKSQPAESSQSIHNMTYLRIGHPKSRPRTPEICKERRWISKPQSNFKAYTSLICPGKSKYASLIHRVRAYLIPFILCPRSTLPQTVTLDFLPACSSIFSTSNQDQTVHSSRYQVFVLSR